MAHSILVVASSADAERIGSSAALNQAAYPHFHCGSLDAGIFGEMFWEISDDKLRFAESAARVEVVYSNLSGTESVVVHALPPQVAQRYAHLSENELNQFASRWAQPNGRIRLPRSEVFYERLLREVAHLASIAVRENRDLLIRTQFP